MTATYYINMILEGKEAEKFVKQATNNYLNKRHSIDFFRESLNAVEILRKAKL